MLLKGIRTVENEAPSFTPLLDTYSTGVKAAYSLRKLSSSATMAVRVRRSTDNTELDIGFSGEHLDTATLLSFAGAGDGYVVTLYDQSGNSAHMSQATAAAQKKIVASGVLITANSRVMGLYDGMNDFYACATGNEGYFTFLHDGTLYSVFTIHQFGFTAEPDIAGTIIANTTATSSVRGMSIRLDDRSGSARNQTVNTSVGNGTSACFTYTIQNNTGISNALCQMTYSFDPSNPTAANRGNYRINGSLTNPANTASAAPSAAAQTTATRLGSITSGSNFLYGYLPEVIMLSGDQSANRAAIELNQKTYFGTP